MPFMGFFSRGDAPLPQTDKVIRIPYLELGREKLLTLDYCSTDGAVWRVVLEDGPSRTVYLSTERSIAWPALKAVFGVNDDFDQNHANLIQYFIRHFFWKDGFLSLWLLNQLAERCDPAARSHALDIGDYWHLNASANIKAFVAPIIILCFLGVVGCIPVIWPVWFACIYMALFLSVCLSMVIINKLPRKGATEAEWANLERIKDIIVEIDEAGGRVSIDPPLVELLPLDGAMINTDTPIARAFNHDLTFPVMAPVIAAEGDESTQRMAVVASLVP